MVARVLRRTPHPDQRAAGADDLAPRMAAPRQLDHLATAGLRIPQGCLHFGLRMSGSWHPGTLRRCVGVTQHHLVELGEGSAAWRSRPAGWRWDAGGGERDALGPERCPNRTHDRGWRVGPPGCRAPTVVARWALRIQTASADRLCCSRSAGPTSRWTWSPWRPAGSSVGIGLAAGSTRAAGPHDELTQAMIAVGTDIAAGPPHRSQRALLTHWAPASGSGIEPSIREGVQHTGRWQPLGPKTAHAPPVQTCALAAAP
jgi:hypothetical protein